MMLVVGGVFCLLHEYIQQQIMFSVYLTILQHTAHFDKAVILSKQTRYKKKSVQWQKCHVLVDSYREQCIISVQLSFRYWIFFDAMNVRDIHICMNVLSFV